MKVTNTSAAILKNQRGFTLIELIMVIVILGILAVVAIPKYQDIQTEARLSAANGVYGAAQGAAAINFAARLVKGTSGPTIITTAATLIAAIEGGIPDGWVDGGGVVLCASATSTAPTAGCAANADYKITITPATAGPPPTKAILVKSGF